MPENNSIDSVQPQPEENTNNEPQERSSLQDLERSLYEREKAQLPSIEKQEERVIGPTDDLESDFSLSEPSSFTGKRLTLWLGGFIVLAAGLAAFIFWQGFFGFARDAVVVEIDAPTQSTAGDEVEWVVRIRNNNREAVEEGQLVFEFPTGSRTPNGSDLIAREQRSIARIAPDEEREERFSARVLGGEGFERVARAKFQFQPAGSSITFQEDTQHTLRITSLPLELTLDGPEETVSGEEVEIVYTLRNTAEQSFSDMRAQLEYPSGFRFIQASSALDEFNTIWEAGSLLAQEERELRVRGEISGFGGEGKIFRGFIQHREEDGWREYSETTARTLLAELPLEVAVELAEAENGAIAAGQRLSYTVRWQNNFDVPLTDLNLSVLLEGDIYDFATLETDGAVSSGGRRIEWSEAQRQDLAVLRPKQGGSVEFRIQTRELSGGVRAPTLAANARISSPTRPAGLTVERVEANQQLETRVHGDILLDARAYYNEPTGLFSNTGPYPFVVGEKTTITVNWDIQSIANSFKNVTIKAILPSGVSWEGASRIRGSLGEISYDPLSREVSWTIDELPANQGNSRNPLEALFAIGVRPTPSQERRVMGIVSETELIATDVFTGRRIEAVDAALNSTLPDDIAGSYSAGRVQP